MDWKSGILLSAAFWACDPRFNPNFELKDPTRKPCVIMLTMENNLYETIERMISFAIGSHVDLTNSNIDELVSMMNSVFSSETCQFIFKFRQNRSITTTDMEAMIQDESLKGNEVVMIVQDYIKRIRPSEGNSSEARHLELGNIVDDFGNIAKRYNIPIVTGMQLNRDSYTKFETAIKNGKLDAVKELSANNVGESLMVFENADVVLFQGRVTSEATSTMYLTVRRAKSRKKRKNNVEFFAQPFELDENGDINEMKLVEDAHLPRKKCRGVLELGDGLSKDYDANNDKDKSGLTKEERMAKRSENVLNGPTKRKTKKIEKPIEKTILQDDDLGLDGL
jgi:hypothetical protein